jgi:hypothetical protein
VPIFSRWHIDFMGPFLPSENGYRYILVAVDWTSKWPVAIPTRSMSSVVVAQFLYEHIFCVFGLPCEIVHDRAKSFLEGVCRDFTCRLQIDHLVTSSYHPQSNGAVERLNAVIGAMLAKECCHTKRNWDTFLPKILFNLRTRTHAVLRTSPFHFVFGLSPSLPGDRPSPLLSLDHPSSVQLRTCQLAALTSLRSSAFASIERQALVMSSRFQHLPRLSCTC